MSEAAQSPHAERWHRGLSLAVTLIWMVVLMSLGRAFSSVLILLLPMAAIWWPPRHLAPKSLNGALLGVMSRASVRRLAWAVLIGMGGLISLGAVISHTFTVTTP